MACVHLCASACFITRLHPFAHVANGQTRAHVGQRTGTPTPMIGVHPWEEKSGNVAAPPADDPRRRAPSWGLLFALPPCYPRHQCWSESAEVRSPCWPRCHGHGLRAAQHCWMGGWGGAWGSRFFLPSMDPILESSPHRPRRLRAPVRAYMPHTQTHIHTETDTHTLSLSLYISLILSHTVFFFRSLSLLSRSLALRW